MLARASRISFETTQRSAIAALVRPPCRYRPLRLPVGAPPRAPWHRHTVQPRTAGARHGWHVRFAVAEQRGACCSRCTGFMRLMIAFFIPPSSCLQIATDNGLPTVMDIDVLNLHALFTSGLCSPVERYFFNASICAVNVRAHLLNMLDALFCWSMVSTFV